MMCRTSITRWRSQRLHGAVLALGGALLLTACSEPADNGPTRTETRSVGDFHSVRIGGAANATIQVGPASSLAVTAGEHTLENLTTEVRNGTLVVEQKNRWFWNGDDVSLAITVPVLRELTVSGAGNVDVQDARGESLQLSVHGAGDLTAAGEINSLSVNINGAGNADLSALRARSAKAVVNGAGNITVNATDELDAVVNGVGKVRYVGSPPKLDTQINGVGDVSQVSPGTN
jgi:hypothetical protein